MASGMAANQMLEAVGIKQVNWHTNDNLPADFMDSLRQLREEYTDVAVAGNAAELKVDRDVYDSKLARWATRIEEARYSER